MSALQTAKISALLCSIAVASVHAQSSPSQNQQGQSVAAAPAQGNYVFDIWHLLDREPGINCQIQGKIEEHAQKAEAETQKAVTDKKGSIQSHEGSAQNANEKSQSSGPNHIETAISRTDFSLDLPQTTVTFSETQIPTVNITNGITSINIKVPSQCKIGSTKIPEFRGIKMTMKGHDILAPCVKDGAIKLTLPQFTAGTTTIRVPQVTTKLVRKNFSLNLPQFTNRDYDKDADSEIKKADAEVTLLNRELDEIKGRNVSETGEAIRLLLKQTRDDMFKQIDDAEKAALNQGRAAYNAVVAARDAANAALERAKVQDARISEGAETAVRQFNGYEAKIQQPFEDQRVKVKQMISDLGDKYLKPVVEKYGEDGLCGPPSASKSLTTVH